MMKRGSQKREKKSLSISGLLDNVRSVFLKVNTLTNGRKITMPDCLMSALAMFSLKSPSLLAFDQGRVEPNIEENLRTLFQINNVPSDTYMREMLDEVDPKELRECYLSVFHEAQRGKLLERYEFLGGYLCLVDGTEVFSSDQVHGRLKMKLSTRSKTRVYQFEHNFGHGKKNLHTVFAYLMMLAFLIDQIQEAACGLFQEALKSMKTRRAFWERVRSFFNMYIIDSWADLYEAMRQRLKFKGYRLNPNTS